MTNLQRYNKAYVPLIVMCVLSVVGLVGITPEMSVEQVITLIATSAGVYLIPNKE